MLNPLSLLGRLLDRSLSICDLSWHLFWRKQMLPEGESHYLLRQCIEKPLVTLIIPASNVKSSKRLIRTVRSIRDQYYDNWELVLVTGNELDRGVAKAIGEDQRIRCLHGSTSQNDTANRNQALAEAKGSYCCWLDAGMELTPDALTLSVIEVNRRPNTKWIYADEIFIGLLGQVQSRFKPDYSPELLLAQDFTGGFNLFATELLDLVGGFREGFDGAEKHDLALRISEQVDQEQVFHLSRSVCFRRSGSGSVARPQADAALRVVSDALTRRSIEASINTNRITDNVIDVRLVPREEPAVTILIATRNAVDLISKCIESIRCHTSYPNYQIVVINNRSDEPSLLRYLETECRRGDLEVYDYDAPFNHSAMHNDVVNRCESEMVVFMNNDVEITCDGWLEQMVGTVQIDSGVAGAGGMLLYPDGTVQHAGMIMGLHGAADHAFKKWRTTSGGYWGRLHSLQEVSGATAALLLLRRKAFESVGGFNESRYPTTFNDVDLWLRLRKSGYRCLYNPLVKAIHHENKTRPIIRDEERRWVRHLQEDWWPELANDPFYNPNFSLDSRQYVGFRDNPFRPELSRTAPMPHREGAFSE